jgi:linoleoyl-CoA desaturase
MLILPVLILPLLWWQVVLGFIAMHAVLSLGICLVLVPSHLFEHTVYVNNSANRQVSAHWAVHQLESTLDYSAGSRLANFLFGGLNTNAAHHLFPRICHIHLVDITRIVKQTASEYGVIYNETSLAGAITSHFKILKQLGRNDSFHEIKP